MKKRLLSILLCLAMLLTLLPAAALAADPAAETAAAVDPAAKAAAVDTEDKAAVSEPVMDEAGQNIIPDPNYDYNSWINIADVPLQVGQYLPKGYSTPTSNMPSGGYAHWDGSTLTLHNYSYTGTGSYFNEYETALIIGAENFTIKLEGNNTLKNTTSGGKGIFAYGCSVTVTGSGSLNLTADYGIYADAAYRGSDGSLITTTGNVAIKSGKVTLNSPQIGISADNSFAMSGGKLTLTTDGYGVWIDRGDVTLKNAIVDITSDTDGIYLSYGDTTVTNSTVNIYAENYGIDTQNLTVTNSKMILYGSNYGAIRCYNGSLTLKSPVKLLYPVNTSIKTLERDDWYNTTIVFDDGAIAAVAAIGVPFTDVSNGSFYRNSVYWAMAFGITDGTSATTFSPNDPCTRAQAVTFLWRAYGEQEASTTHCPFTDVNKNAFYYDAMMWAVENGITNGTTATTFSPNDPCTRGQIVTLLWRAFGEERPIPSSCAFTDISTSAYYYNAMMWATQKNITNGTTPTTFSPHDPCTRGQIVTFLYRYLKS